MNTVYINGRTVDFDAALALMDADICTALHGSTRIFRDAQQFADAYCREHYSKYNEIFEVN